MPVRNLALYIAIIALAAGLFALIRRPVGTPAENRQSALPSPIEDSLLPWGMPKGHEAQGRQLRKSCFAALHDSRLKISRWVAYRAEGDTAGVPRYPGQFYAEPEIPAGHRAELSDYQGLWSPDMTGFDKGHQAPDATIKKYGREAQRETYSLANITPQHSQINQGVWSDIEAAVRKWSSQASPVWVVTGPVFFADQETTWVGANRVAVPHGYYAVLSKGAGPDVISFLVPNTAEAPWYSSLTRFLVSVDSVEKLSGLDLLPALPDSLEQRLEANQPKALWQ